MGHVTTTTPLSGTVCRRWTGSSHDKAVYQIYNLYVHTLGYEDHHITSHGGNRSRPPKASLSEKITKATKIQKLGWFGGGGLGVTQGDRQHDHLIERIAYSIPIRL